MHQPYHQFYKCDKCGHAQGDVLPNAVFNRLSDLRTHVERVHQVTCMPSYEEEQKQRIQLPNSCYLDPCYFTYKTDTVPSEEDNADEEMSITGECEEDDSLDSFSDVLLQSVSSAAHRTDFIEKIKFNLKNLEALKRDSQVMPLVSVIEKCMDN